MSASCFPSTLGTTIHHQNRNRLSSPPTPVYSVDLTLWQGLCLLQLKEAPTCMSTSCLIILPSAHLSAARASPRNMDRRRCRKAKQDISHPHSQEKDLADLRNQSETTSKMLPFLLPPPSHSSPEEKACSSEKNIVPCLRPCSPISSPMLKW